MKTLLLATLLVTSGLLYAQSEELPEILAEEETLAEENIVASAPIGGDAETAEIEKTIAAPAAASSDAKTQVVSSEAINVDGYVKEKKVTDGELESLKSEISKQKKEMVLNKKKSQSYKELSASVEKLSEATEEYLEEKRAAQQQIAEYNLKVKCMQAENPGKECDKYVRRR